MISAESRPRLAAKARLRQDRRTDRLMILFPEKGLELSLDHRFDRGVTAFANYSWQSNPEVLSDPNPYPAAELVLPPTNRFNAGVNVDGPRFLGSATVNYSDKSFWTDVLTAEFHGFTDAYTLVNGAFGVKWMQGKVTTLVKVNNLLDKDIQQHVFGDILKRSAVLEVRIVPPRVP